MRAPERLPAKKISLVLKSRKPPQCTHPPDERTSDDDDIAKRASHFESREDEKENAVQAEKELHK